MIEDKKKYFYSYNCESFRNNIHFLERIKACIRREVDEDIRKVTLEQIDMMIEEEKERVKSKHGNGMIHPNLIR